MHNVFVYGTLKSGFGNAHHLNESILLGAARTQQSYPFYLQGERYSPWLIDQQGSGAQINGEVYCVSEEVLQRLDKLERTHLESGYFRKEIEVLMSVKHEAKRVYCYFKRLEALAEANLMSESLSEYTAAHAALYQRRL